MVVSKKYKIVSLLIVLALILTVGIYAIVRILNTDTNDTENVNAYTNNGEKIEINETVNINLSLEKHTDKADKLFIGWQTDDGHWAKLKDVYSKGDTLTACYIDFTADDFAINDISLKEEDELKLIMGFEQTEAINNIPKINEYGVIWAETDVAGGRELRLNTEVVKSWSWDKEEVNKFTPSSLGYIPEKQVGSNVAFIPITSLSYNTFYTARGYIKYTDKNGLDGIIYTLETSSSAYKVAVESVDNKPFYASIIKSVKNYDKVCIDLIEEEIVETYNKQNVEFKRNTDSYDVFSNLSGASSYVARKRTVYLENTGIKETINLGWLTDMHVFNVNQTDVDKQIVNALSTYRGSSWLWEGGSLNRAIDQINYMNSRYNKTIITGDIADIYAYGTYNAVKALVSDKSVNGSILMTTGNHEFMELCNPDIKDLPYNFSNQQKYEMLKKYWANDPTYYAEILKTSKGEDNAMVILLDNGLGEYYNGTAEKLEKSLMTAKEKNIPVLIFQHVAMPTYNSDGKAYVTSETGMSYTAVNNINSLNDTSDNNKKVYSVIRQNADVIKGVFGGHEHINSYSEITALDDNGNILPDKYIPQFLGAGYQQNWANEIVLN